MTIQEQLALAIVTTDAAVEAVERATPATNDYYAAYGAFTDALDTERRLRREINAMKGFKA